MTKDEATLDQGKYFDFPENRDVFYNKEWYLIESIGIWNFNGLDDDWHVVIQFFQSPDQDCVNLKAESATTRIHL